MAKHVGPGGSQSWALSLTTPAAVSQTEDTSPRKVFGAPDIEKLTAKRDHRGLAKALDYLKDTDVRVAAATALGEIGDERAIQILVKSALTHPVNPFFGDNGPDHEVGSAAAAALARIGPEAVAPLVEALGLTRDSPAVRGTYAEAIDVHKKRSARDPYLLLVGAAASALGEIEWQPAARRLARLEVELADRIETERPLDLQRSVQTAPFSSPPPGGHAGSGPLGELEGARARVTLALERIYGWYRPRGKPPGYVMGELASRQAGAPVPETLRADLVVESLETVRARLETLPSRYPPLAQPSQPAPRRASLKSWRSRSRPSAATSTTP